MLILPPGHAEAVRARRSFRTREKWMVGVVLGVVAALAIAVVLSLSATGHTSGGGCIDVVVPYSTGGQEFYRCGATARAMCAEVGTPTGYNGVQGLAVADQCRKAGLGVGS